MKYGSSQRRVALTLSRRYDREGVLESANGQIWIPDTFCRFPDTFVASGVGKTHLCVALGLRAIGNGFSVCFYRVDELLYQLKADADVSPARLKHKKYTALNLLILDEFGYQTLDRDRANQFFRFVNYRYQRGSIALTTNKGITSWPEVLAGDEVLGRGDPGPSTAQCDGVDHPGPQLSTARPGSERR